MMTQNADKKRKQIQLFCMDDMVPQDHLLRIIDKAIDWSFIHELAEEKYSQDNGHPSMDPVILKKEINEDCEAHGKRPLKEKDDNNNPPSGPAGGREENTVKASSSDQESGWFRKGEYKNVQDLQVLVWQDGAFWRKQPRSKNLFYTQFG